MKDKIVIIGAGGHGKVICDAVLAQNKYDLLGFVDDALPIGTIVLKGYKVIENQKNIHQLKKLVGMFVVGIGNNKVRERIYNLAIQFLEPGIIIHPTTIIGSEVIVGKGSVILANGIVNTNSKIGINSIVNLNSVVDHDCIIGDHVHLSIGSLVGSNSTICDYYASAIGEKIPSFSKVIIKL